MLATEDGRPPSGPEIIDWDEPYKDGGPDAAHARLRRCDSRRESVHLWLSATLRTSLHRFLAQAPSPAQASTPLVCRVAGALTALWSGIAFNLRVTGQRLLRSTVEPAVDRQYPQVVSPPTA